ncbi:N-acetylmuramoyl-L-alanine amidase [Achromobacter kerstersii]|uniref:N-acetylmuramoyl-L-alanine amidase n=1 Tax=Achromobacter kerstersii TaxID=1353890 RepID=UPI00313D79F0
MEIRENQVQSPGVQFLESPNHGAGIMPLYLIVHYTAGTALDGATTWFMDPNSEVSAHFIIDHDGTIVQMIRLNRRAWHAGKSSWGDYQGMNQFSFGVELVNAGMLNKTAEGNWVNYSGKKISSDQVIIARHKHQSDERGWQIYPEAQLNSLVELGRLLTTKYGILDVLGHDDVAPNRKQDPGPAFPMISIRSRILGGI